MDIDFTAVLVEMFSLTTAAALIGLSQAIACGLWTIWDPLFKHPLCRVPFIAGFISFGAIVTVALSPETQALEFILAIASVIFMMMGGVLHQHAATRVMLSRASKVSKIQFLITEVVLMGYLGCLLLAVILLFKNTFYTV